MRVVLDTNALASGMLGSQLAASVPGALLRAWRAEAFQLLVSDPILTELDRTLRKPYFRQRLSDQQRAAVLVLLRDAATLQPLTVTVTGVATHLEDDLILATAVAAQADYLVTGDSKLQQLGTYRGVLLVSPRLFLTVLQEIDQAAP